MSNFNYGGCLKSAEENNVKEFQTILGKENPRGKNVIGINIGGYTFDRLSNFTKSEFDALFMDIKTLGVAKAYEVHVASRSVARQKVNRAWGRSVGESFINKVNQEFTYADSIKPLIQLKGARLVDALECLKDLTENSKSIMGDNMNKYNTWVKHVIAWYTDKESCRDYKNGMKNAKDFIMTSIKTGKIHLIGEFIYTNYNLYQFVRLWCSENQIETTPEKIQEYVDRWVDSYGGI